MAVDGVRWDLVADALESLMDTCAVEKALILGWEPLELIGVQRTEAHDHPAVAGLIFSLQPGDTVTDLRTTGSAIAIGGSNVRHIWRRAPLTPATVLPWALSEVVT